MFLGLAGKHFAAVVLCGGAMSFAVAQPSNSTLRDAVSRAMAGHRGTAVMIDVSSGRVLAAFHLDVAARRLVQPGSSIKPFTLMALLGTGKVNAHTALMCKRTVHRWPHPRLHASRHRAPLDPAAALAYSCNSYFTSVALRG